MISTASEKTPSWLSHFSKQKVSSMLRTRQYGKTVVAIAAGASHSVALCSDGSVAAWGWNLYGQLGDGTATISPPFGETVPAAVNTNSGVSALYGKTVVAIGAGYYHSLAVCSDGTAAAWGRNDYGQIGDTTTTERNAPVPANTTPLAVSQLFTRVTSGSSAYHTLALVAAPPASQINLTGAQTLSDGSFQFAFTNTPGAFFGVLAANEPGAAPEQLDTAGRPDRSHAWSVPVHRPAGDQRPAALLSRALTVISGSHG
jgi:hypothetical protein